MFVLLADARFSNNLLCGAMLAVVVLTGLPPAMAAITSDGSVFSDDMSDLDQWSTHYVGGQYGGTITPSGHCYTIDCMWEGGDLNSYAEMYTSGSLDYGTKPSWAVEIRFRVNVNYPQSLLSYSDTNRQIGLLIGASSSSTSITGIRDYCLTLLEHSTDGNQFNIGWGDMNGLRGGSPETLITNIRRYEYHTLVVHHKANNTLDFYLDGVYKASKSSINYGGSRQAQRVFIADSAQVTGVNIDIDYVKIGDPVSGSSITSNGSMLNSEFKDLTGWSTNYAGGQYGGTIAPLHDFTNFHTKWVGGAPSSYAEMYTTTALSYGSLTSWATEMRFRVNAFSTGEPLSVTSPDYRQVGLLIGAKSDTPGDSWDPTVDYSVVLVQTGDKSKYSLCWGKMNQATPPSLLISDLSRGTYYTLVLHHKSDNYVDIYLDGMYRGSNPAIYDNGICKATRLFISDSSQVVSADIDVDYLKVGAPVGNGPASPSWVTKSAAPQTIYQNGTPHTDKNGNFRLTYSAQSSFFPLMASHAFDANIYGSDWSFADLVAAGFNVANYPTGLTLTTTEGASAVSAGIQLIHEYPTDQEINDLKNYSSMLAWIPFEEPTNTGVTYSEYLTRRSQILALDPNHPVFILDGAWITEPNTNNWIQWNTSGDVTCHDNYPINGKRQSLSFEYGIPESVSLAVSANVESVPMWFVSQSFGYLINNSTMPMPSAQQLRCMVYTSIVHGATGIMHFILDSYMCRDGGVYIHGIAPEPLAEYSNPNYPHGVASPDQINQSRNLWMGAVSLNSEIASIKSSLLSPTASVAYHVNVDSNLPSITTTPIRTLLKQDPNGGCTLLVVNVDNKPQNVQIVFPNHTVTANELFKSGTQFTNGSNYLEFVCLPYDVHVFHVDLGMSSSGSIFGDEFVDMSNWTIQETDCSPGASVSAGMLHFDSTTGTYLNVCKTNALNYGGASEWVTEVCFRVNSGGTLTWTDGTNWRETGLLVGMSSRPYGWTTDYGLFLANGSSSGYFNLTWGTFNTTAQPSTLVSNLARGTWHTVGMHHMSNGRVNIYVNGNYVTTKDAISLGGVTQASYIGLLETSGSASGSFDLDFVRVGAPVAY